MRDDRFVVIGIVVVVVVFWVTVVNEDDSWMRVVVTLEYSYSYSE